MGVDLPEIDEYGLLRYRGAWVALSPKEEVVLRRLLVAWPRVVSRERLLASGWPDRSIGSTTALDKVLGRLRRRLASLDLTIETVRARGLVLRAIDTRDHNEGLPCPTSSPPSSSRTSSRR